MPVTIRPSSGGTSQGHNGLIDRLPKRQRTALLNLCEVVELVQGSVLCDTGSPLRYIYFPLQGSISLTRQVIAREPFETSSIGSEGMLGAMLILGVNRAPQRGVVQSQGQALRLASSKLRPLLVAEPKVLRILQRYLAVVVTELTYVVGCARLHTTTQRLAHRLLQAHDRVEDDELHHFTHKTLASLLGVQRGAVTLAAASLQRQEIIRYRRGNILVRDRAGLEAAACGCYQDSRGCDAMLFPDSDKPP